MPDPNLPYRQIPAYPDAFTASNMAARMIDGLGFRYFWATENLNGDDLTYRPSPEARTTEETIDHLYFLAELILNTVKGEVNVRPVPELDLPFMEKRNLSLTWFKEASDRLKAMDDPALGELNVVFQWPGKTLNYPFWNLINGPVADALWHVGQLVSFRRSSGNPLHPKVRLFSGKVKE